MTYYQITVRSGQSVRQFVMEEGDRLPSKKDLVRIKGLGSRVWKVINVSPAEPVYLERVS